MLTPRLESVVAEKKGEVLLAKVDIDENTDLALDYEVLLLLEQFKQKLLICWKIPHCTVQVTLRIPWILHGFQEFDFACGKLWVGFAVLHCTLHVWWSGFHRLPLLSLKRWYSGMAGHHFCHFSRFNLTCAFCSCWLWKIIFFNTYFRSHLNDIMWLYWTNTHFRTLHWVYPLFGCFSIIRYFDDAILLLLMTHWALSSCIA